MKARGGERRGKRAAQEGGWGGLNLAPIVSLYLSLSCSLVCVPPSDDSVNVIRVASQFGLCVFMFLVGMELDVAEFQANLRSVVVISGVGVLVPLLIAAPTALMFDSPDYSNTSFFNLTLFLGVSIGMSALPVLARILSERNMLTSPLGNLIMGATSIDDVMAWIVLAVVVAIVRSSQQLNILWTILMALGNILLVIFVMRPLLARWCRDVRRPSDVTQSVFFMVFSVLLANSWFCEAIGLSALVGAFEVGLCLPRNRALLSEMSARLEDFIVISQLREHTLRRIKHGVGRRESVWNDTRRCVLLTRACLLAFGVSLGPFRSFPASPCLSHLPLSFSPPSFSSFQS